MFTDFKGKVAVVTGAASGLGLAIAEKLYALQARLVLIDRNGGLLVNATGHLQELCVLYTVDLTNEEQVKNLMGEVAARFGSIDILINAAGITGKTNIKSHEVETDDLRSVFDVNFFACHYTSKYALPVMLEQRYGRILHIASIAGKEGNLGMLAYSASKAAVIAMAKVQGKEYAEHNITINALAPAVIQTALVKALSDEVVKYMTDKIPMKRCGTLEEVADLVTFIVSSHNSFCTGFTFDLSGGRATY